MRIFLPVHCIRAGRIGGVEQMIQGLWQGLATHGHAVTLATDNLEHLAPAMRGSAVQAPSGRLAAFGARQSRFIGEQLACLTTAAQSDFTIFPNYHTPAFLPRRIGTVATVIHDIQYTAYPAYFSAQKRAWLRWAQQWTLRNADVVVAISEFVKTTLCEAYGSAYEGKIAVVYNPIDWTRFGAAEAVEEAAPARRRPFVLSVAADFPHKNLSTLIKAFARLVTRFDVDLVLVGQRRKKLGHHVRGGDDLDGLVEELGLEDRVRQTGYIGDARLAQLYKTAAVFAFPSLYEGFGMPPIEAMGFGVPTLTTRKASLPEVTLQKASYVDDPLNPDEWADKLAQILQRPEAFRLDPETVAHFRNRYAPERIAQDYVKVGEEAGGRR